MKIIHVNRPMQGPETLDQQAFRWFRNNHKITHEIHESISKDEYWGNLIVNKHPDLIKYDDEKGTAIVFNSYEEVELECLRKLIEIVKQR